jgi:hypothetical protein
MTHHWRKASITSLWSALGGSSHQSAIQTFPWACGNERSPERGGIRTVPLSVSGRGPGDYPDSRSSELPDTGIWTIAKNAEAVQGLGGGAGGFAEARTVTGRGLRLHPGPGRASQRAAAAARGGPQSAGITLRERLECGRRRAKYPPLLCHNYLVGMIISHWRRSMAGKASESSSLGNFRRGVRPPTAPANPPVNASRNRRQAESPNSGTTRIPAVAGPGEAQSSGRSVQALEEPGTPNRVLRMAIRARYPGPGRVGAISGGTGATQVPGCPNRGTRAA